MTLSLTVLLGLVGLACLTAGILVGRYYVPDDRMLRRTARHARSYARAASRILEGERDEAIEELKQVVAENVDDIEPYFALGALFRGRGEWERAIRIHQAIIARDTGNKQIQVRALYALGLDFRRAGMPRRATRAMEECLALDGKHEGALKAVIGLYEEQGRYEEAGESLHRLHKLRGQEPSSRQHHLLVAASQRAVYAGDVDRAKRLLREARRIDEHSVHYLAAAAELSAARGDAARAGARLRDALREAPELAGFLAPGLVETERQIVMSEWAKRRGKRRAEPDAPEEAARAQLEEAARRAVDALEEVADAHEPHLQLAMAELRSHYDPARALEDYRRIAETFPGLLPARVAAARLALADGDPDEIRAELKALVVADGVLSWATEGTWRCSGCGHRQQEFFWRCASCRGWGTARLDIGRDALELPPPPPWEPSRMLRGGVDVALRSAAGRALPAPMGAPMEPSDPAGERSQPSAALHPGTAPTMLSRVGAWFSGISMSMGGRRRDRAAARPRELGPGDGSGDDSADAGSEARAGTADEPAPDQAQPADAAPEAGAPDPEPTHTEKTESSQS